LPSFGTGLPLAYEAIAQIVLLDQEKEDAALNAIKFLAEECQNAIN
jgi:hypothetical protein